LASLAESGTDRELLRGIEMLELEDRDGTERGQELEQLSWSVQQQVGLAAQQLGQLFGQLLGGSADNPLEWE
jgi:hypothetical protein